jgi:invasion protein IalB
MTSGSRHRVLAPFALLFAGLVATGPSSAQDAPVSGWRVECTSDGKALDCRAVQQMINREDKQLVAQLTARIAPETKAPTLTVQLPLGISLTEPVQLKVDNGAVERLAVQTCTNAGCIVSIPLKDPFLASLRNGTTLKVTLQDPSKRAINIDVPLMGFALAFDKAAK